MGKSPRNGNLNGKINEHHLLLGGLERDFYFPQLGWSNLTNSIIFQDGWNHQLDNTRYGERLVQFELLSGELT